VCVLLPASPYLLARGDVAAAHLAYGVIAALMLAPAVFADGSAGLPGRVLAQPVVAWLGLVSYGIFLWHFAVTAELGRQGADASFPVVLLGGLVISIALAATSYYLVERPLLRFKYRG
jgi:peptidoglycan/LPS O-acetylase OafA/YrhL